jgi:glycosyltransferase involved in cell wall biosynthesis
MNDSFPPIIDGVANAVVNYAANIEQKLGHAVVVTPAMPGTDDSIYPFPVLRYPSIDTRKLVGYVTGYPFSPEVVRRLNDEHVALMHTHCPVTSMLLARSLRGVIDAPLVFTYHTKYDIDIAKAVHSKLLQESAIRALVQNISACDEIWVVSRGAGENMRSLGYEGDYIVMENGVDVPRGRVEQALIDRVTAPYDLPAGVPVFLFVGRMMWYKGLRIILDALKALRESGTEFRMVFVGDGADGAAVRAYTKELGLEDRCFFTGAIIEREEIRAWYCRADLFLFPSTFDTNGLVVREAAACALGSVLVRGSCAAEDVEDGVSGVLIEENAASMAAALERLIGERGTMRRIGEGAQRELYISWEDAVANAFSRYGAVIENYRSGAYAALSRGDRDIYHAVGEVIDRYNLAREYQRLARESAVLSYAGVRTGIEDEVERMRAMQAEDTALAAMKLEELKTRVTQARAEILLGREKLHVEAQGFREDFRARLRAMLDDVRRPNDRFL